jgi:hypothetical protein
VPENLAALVGRYLKVAVHQGEPITSAKISSQPFLARQTNAIAAIIMVPVATASALRLDVGMHVQICRGAQPFGEHATVAATECGEHTCSVTLFLPKMSEQIDPASIADATLIGTGAPTPCSRK